jgi:hypothetical protein
MLGPRSRGSQLQGPAGPVQSGVDPAGRGLTRLVGVGDFFSTRKKKNFFFRSSSCCSKQPAQELRIAGFQSFVFFLFFFIHFFDKFCSLPDCWIWKALWYDAMGEVLVLNWKSSWIER